MSHCFAKALVCQEHSVACIVWVQVKHVVIKCTHFIIEFQTGDEESGSHLRG